MFDIVNFVYSNIDSENKKVSPAFSIGDRNIKEVSILISETKNKLIEIEKDIKDLLAVLNKRQ